MVGLETGELADLRDAHEDWVETVSEKLTQFLLLLTHCTQLLYNRT